MTTPLRGAIVGRDPNKEQPMASDQHLVLAFFDNEAAADGAADAVRSWAKTNPRVELEALGVLVRDVHGEVKTHKLGPRETSKGLGIGVVLGAVAAVASGGISLLEGVAVGGAGGGVLGSLFHKSLGMTREDLDRISSRLDAGHAAVGALVLPAQADAVSEELQALGGEPEVHPVSSEQLAAAGTSS
jgi:uncharacterized membrane protein